MSSTSTYNILFGPKVRKANKKRLKQKHDWVAKTETFSPGIEKRGLKDKNWVRTDQERNIRYRTWKNAKFLDDNWFIVGLQKNRTARSKRPSLYHICAQVKDIVLYSKINQSKGEYVTECYCGDKVPDNIKMLFRLQKLKNVK